MRGAVVDDLASCDSNSPSGMLGRIDDLLHGGARMTRTCCTAVAAVVLGSSLVVTDAGAIVTMRSPSPVAARAATDNPSRDEDQELQPQVAGDGAGNWIAVWDGSVPLYPTPVTEIWTSRSADNGSTWTDAAALVALPQSDHNPVIASDTNGNWLVVWDSNDVDGLVISRSTDAGASWSLPVEILADANDPTIATDSAGTWVVIGDTGSSRIMLVRSTDNGSSWSVPQQLDTDDPGGVVGSYEVVVETDRNGTWVALYRSGRRVYMVRSTDDAVTWSAPVQIGLDEGQTLLIARPPGLAFDGEGNWVGVWEGNQVLASTDTDLYFSRSTDGGATWTPQVPIPGVGGDPGFDEVASFRAGLDGALYLVWSINLGTISGKDVDVFMSRTFDGGLSWTTASAINLRGRNDSNESDDIMPTLGFDGAESWVAMWTSTNSFEGTIGDDYDILFATAHDDCPAAPMNGCLTPTESGASRIVIKDDVSGGNDRLSWRWTHGQQTLPAQVGDPTATADYVLCLYDKVGAGLRAVFEADAEAGLGCSGEPCWTGSAGVYFYRDGARSNGSIKSLDIAAGEAGRSRIKIKAMGDAVGPPHMPLVKNPSVKAQLINLQTNACWEATYSTATTNTATRFKALSD